MNILFSNFYTKSFAIKPFRRIKRRHKSKKKRKRLYAELKRNLKL